MSKNRPSAHHANTRLANGPAWPRWLRALAACLVFVGCGVQAGCWQDMHIEQMMIEIARRHFNSDDVPRIMACSGDQFPPGVGGDHNAGFGRIRININAYPRPDQGRYVAIAHELGHHYASRRSEDSSFGGHGPVWMQVMREAGFDPEVQRVLPMYPGLASLYQGQLGGFGWDGGAYARPQDATPPPLPQLASAQPQAWNPAPVQPNWLQVRPRRHAQRCVQHELVKMMPTPWGMQRWVTGYELRCNP